MKLFEYRKVEPFECFPKAWLSACTCVSRAISGNGYNVLYALLIRLPFLRWRDLKHAVPCDNLTSGDIYVGWCRPELKLLAIRDTQGVIGSVEKSWHWAPVKAPAVWKNGRHPGHLGKIT